MFSFKSSIFYDPHIRLQNGSRCILKRLILLFFFIFLHLVTVRCWLHLKRLYGYGWFCVSYRGSIKSITIWLFYLFDYFTQNIYTWSWCATINIMLDFKWWCRNKMYKRLQWWCYLIYQTDFGKLPNWFVWLALLLNVLHMCTWIYLSNILGVK